MTDKSIRYAIRQLEKGRDTKTVAKELNVTQRHIQRLWAEYLKTGVIHIQRPAGRPPDLMPSDEMIQTVLNTHKNKPEGYVRTAKKLKSIYSAPPWFSGVISVEFHCSTPTKDGGLSMYPASIIKLIYTMVVMYDMYDAHTRTAMMALTIVAVYGLFAAGSEHAGGGATSSRRRLRSRY